MYLYVERIRDFFGLCAIQIYFLLLLTNRLYDIALADDAVITEKYRMWKVELV